MTGICFLDYSFLGRYAYGIYVFVTIAAYIGAICAAKDGTIPITFMLDKYS